MKTQIKKSLSLFLAVLMILSCWVWVAPEKAEAGSVSATTYTVEIQWTISQRNCDGGDIQYKTLGNGWGSESSYIVALSSMSDRKNQGTYTYSWTTDAFPSVVKITTKGGFVMSNPSRCVVNYLKINGKTVFDGGTGKVAFNLPTWNSNASASAEMYPNYTDTDNSGTSGNLDSGYNWPRPMIAGFVDNGNDAATANDINISLNKVGGQNVYGSTEFNLKNYNFYDQYGKAITDADKATFLNNNRFSGEITTTTHVSGTKDSGETTDYASDIWVDPNNADGVVVSPNLQVNNPKGSTGLAELYLVRTYKVKDSWGGEQTSRVSSKINVKYPEYTVKFDAGLSSAKITVDKEYTGSYTPSNFHGGTITLPSNTKAEGYTFHGYWSKPQPTGGDASYNAVEANFATPCSTDDYNSYKSAAGSTESNGIVTDKDGNKWYDAGKKLDPSTAKTINVEGNVTTPNDTSDDLVTTWYGWWLANDLSVKFYDVDGSFLGEKVVKSGQTQKDIEWPTSKYINSGYTSGAFKFNVDANFWEATNGEEINKDSYTFTKDLILTPKLTRESFKDKYEVSFINPNDGNSVNVGTEAGDYNYRQSILAHANEALGKIAATPNDVNSDLEFSYELLGWSSVKPTTGKNYHVLLEDADFDVNGTAIGLNSDWVVRNEATYYAVYRRLAKTYVVNFNYKDATGADATRQLKVKYGANLVPPTEYVPYSYVTKGFGYTFDKWSYANADGKDATLDYNATIPFTSENIQIEGAALDDGVDVEAIKIAAIYGDPVATPYTVTFNYVDSGGDETASSSVEVRNEQFILQTTVESLKPTEKWDFEDNLYTYADKWEITEGSATVGVGGAEKKVGDIIDTTDLTTLTPTSNITFKAVYANPVPFFTVTYIDGDKTFTDRVLQGSNVPEWTYKATNDNGTPDNKDDDFEEDKIYVPADYKGEGGKYVFQGWYDQNGNKITAADKVTGNLTLTSQFKFVADTFTITFMNHDGTVQLAAGKYEKGQNIEALIATATKAAQGRASDETYDYLFLGWDKPVPTFCEGSDITFTAQYKPVYKYYDVKWYNSKLVDGKWVADKSTSQVDGKEVETNLLATTHHTYNSKLYTPAVDSLVCLETAPEGQSYVFAGWYYNDAEGNAVKYERGMLVTAEMEFYATYTLTAKTYTVTTVVKGEETKYTVASGATAEIPEPQAGYVDATKHDAFEGWYTDADCTTAFSADTAITADTKIYAKFTEGEHDFTEKELVTAPTYYTEGKMDVWCSCDKAKTKTTETIDELRDTKTPTGTIYLGGNSWSSEGEAANITDNDPISIFVNADTDVIITANDTGDVDALYNPAGLGIGVKYIRAFAFPADTVLTADNYGAAQQVAINVYEDLTEDATNNANFAVKLGDFVVADLDENGNPQDDEDNNVKFKPLESGKSYIIYYYVNDKATEDNSAEATGNQLNRKVRTAKFIYDNTAPVFTIKGKSNEATIPTYCGIATVEGIEKDTVLTVNGVAVTATFVDDAETGTYEIKYAEGIDNVIITATDKAGNTYSKKIKVADHSYITTEAFATCGVAGYKKVECIICGDVKTNDTYPALYHIYSQREVIPADCVNIGSIVVTCEICGDKITTQYEEDGVTPVIPELGHVFVKDDNDEIIYTTVTKSTCKTNGLAEAYCTECNGELEGGYITKTLELDSENHEDITVTDLAADCIHDGYYTKACSCGVTIDSKTYPATGHGTIEAGTAEWYVRTEPTCYEKGEKVLKCLVCSNFVEVDGEEVTEEIAATGEHVKTVTNPDTYKIDGVVKYHCATEGCTYKYADKPYVNTALKEYTVTFKNEAGDAINTFKVLEGTYIAKDAVTAPEKAETAEYKYSFAGWSDGKKTYKLPLEVTSDLTLQATYKSTKILYAHQFLIPAYNAETNELDYVNTVAYRKLLGAIGDERVPAGTPVVDTGSDTTFKFKGWKRVTTGADANDIVTDFIVAEDKTFVAMFDTEVAVYDVVFYNGYDYVWNTTVPSGSKVTFDGEEPTKDPDAEYHYTFNGWYTDLSGKDKFNFNTAITGKTRLYAGYTATEHTLERDVDDKRNVAATCTTAGAEVYVCKYCDYDEVRTVNALDHDWEDDWTNEDGVKGAHCKVCGEFVEAAANKFTVKFMNGKSTLAKYTIVEGNKIVLDVELEPTKAEDAEFKYTFNGKWACNNKEYTLSQILEMEIDADYTFEACYDATKQVYKVSYIDDDNNIIVTKDVEYGEKLYAFEGANPTRERDDLYHYEFKGWDKEAGKYVVKGDTYVSPEFDKFDHVFGEEETTEATCTEAGSTVKSCECGYKQIQKVNIPALGHTDVIDEATGEKVEHTIVKPTYKTEGSDSYVCQRCGVVVTVKLDKLPSTEIVITVKDANGNLAVDGSAKVTITNKNNAADTQFNYTDMNGQVRFTVAAGQEWIVGITGNNLPQGGYGFELGKGETSFEASPDKEVEDDDHGCSCSCHKTSFWGIIFRLFQKFIRLFTGKLGCCSDPDPMYG